MTLFSDLWLNEHLLTALAKIWYTSPTPIQEATIPLWVAGNDVFWCAQTGTGKTAAFCLPLLHTLLTTRSTAQFKDKKRRAIRGLIVTPTRELAVQIGENLKEYSTNTTLENTVIFGWVKQSRQVRRLRAWVDILVATPWRLLDLINQKHINLNWIEVFVLDEADRMLDMWFIHDMKKLQNFLPKKKQTLFFSATVAPHVTRLSEQFLKKPKHISVTPPSSTVEKIDQRLYTLKKEDKRKLLLYLLEDISITSAVIFTRTKHGADKIVKLLRKAWIESAALHGNKSQNARQRALTWLKDGSVRILVATDIAARWIDVDLLSHVIIYDVPREPEVYVHRIGRTWRAGQSWMAMMLCEPEEIKYLRLILKLIDQDIDIVTEQPFHLDFSTVDFEQVNKEVKKKNWEKSKRQQNYKKKKKKKWYPKKR